MPVPVAPSNLTATAISNQQVNLQWQDNSNNEDNFAVRRRLSSEINFTTIANLPTNTTSFSDTLVQPNTSYVYVVRSVNASGGAASNEAPVTTPALQPPAAPSNLTATAISSQQVNLQWQDNSNNEDNFAVRRRLSTEINFTTIATLPANTTSFSDTTVQPNTSYVYLVRSVNAAGGAASNEAPVTTPAALQPPAAPTNLTATAISSQQVNLQWQDKSNNEDNFAVRRRLSTDINFATIATLPANTTSFSDTTAQPNTSYVYVVRAVNAAGGSASNEASVMTPAALQPPAAPSNLTATAISSQQVNLQWQDNSNNEDNFALRRRLSTEINFTTIATLPGNTTSFSDTTAQPSTSYVYLVRAVNAAGGAGSNEAPVTTPAALQPPAAPSNLTATAISSQQVNLQWQDNSNNEDNFAVRRRLSTEINFTTIATRPANTTSFSDTTVQPSTSYVYVVRSVNAAGGALSNEAPVTTPAALQPPAAPSNLTATAVSTQQVNLQWQDNSNNEDNFALRRRLSTETNFTTIATLPANTTSFSDTTVQPNTSYVYVVRSVNAAGGALSNEASVMTPQGDMQAPIVTVLFPNGGEVFQSGQPVTILWQSSDNVGIIAHDVQFSATGGAPFMTIAANLSGAQQSFNWTVPPQPTMQGVIKVVARDAAGNTGSDTSNGSFTIQLADTMPPSVTVLAPNGGERLNALQQFLITWQSSDNVGVVSHDIMLSTDGGVTFSRDIVRGLGGNVQSFLWTVPNNLTTTQAKVRVVARDAAGNQFMDESNAVFMITPSANLTAMIASIVPSQILSAAEGQPPLVSRVVVNGTNLPVTASQYSVTDSSGQPVSGVRILPMVSGSPERVTLQIEVASSVPSIVAQLQVESSTGVRSTKPITIVSNACGRRLTFQHRFLSISQPPLTTSTNFKFVLSFRDAIAPFQRPATIFLNTADPAKGGIRIDPEAFTPPGVVIDDANGTISFFVDSPGPWFIQSFYRSDGDVVCYAVLSEPINFSGNQPRMVDISPSRAVHSISFRPVDFRGTEIDGCPSTEGSRLVFQFIHRQTGHFVLSEATGFGKSSRILVSDVPADYSFGAIGGFGPDRSIPLHLYLYSYRNGIRSDLELTNSAGQLARREVITYPGIDTPLPNRTSPACSPQALPPGSETPLFLLPVIGSVVYNPGDVLAFAPKSLPKVFGLTIPNLITSLRPGLPADVYVFSSADTSLALSDAANARTPDFPTFHFELSTTGDLGAPGDTNARNNVLFTTPIFTANADQQHSFFSVDTTRAQFDRLEVPAPGQIPIGTSPLFDATIWVKNSDLPDFRDLRAQHFMSADSLTDISEPGRLANSGYVTHLAADGANQGEVVNFRNRAKSSFTLKRRGTVVNQGTFPVISAEPVLLSGLNRGDYSFTLCHPGINIGGTLFPVTTKSSFKVGPGLDGSPPAIRKLMLLSNGRLANMIDAAGGQNLLLFNVDPAPGRDTPPDGLQRLTLAVSRVNRDSAGPFQRLSLTPLPNGDMQASLPAVMSAVRFDFKIVATDLGNNRLVTRFSLPIGQGQEPGAPPVPDPVVFAVSPANLNFSLTQGGMAPAQDLLIDTIDDLTDFILSTNASWLSVSQTDGTTPSTVTVSVNGAGLVPGVYQADISIAAAELGTTANISVPVRLEVTPPSAKAELSSNPMAQTINRGQNAIFTIAISRTNFTGPVDLFVSGLPAGATAAFAPDPTTGTSSTLTVTTSATTPAGNSTLTIGATASGVTIMPITVSLTVNVPAPMLPVISGFSPTAGPVRTNVAISGSNFINVSGVQFNGVSASFFVNSPNSITATVPMGATTGPITVTTPGGTARSPQAFNVIESPPKEEKETKEKDRKDKEKELKEREKGLEGKTIKDASDGLLAFADSRSAFDLGARVSGGETLEPIEGNGRAFISAAERPAVGERALKGSKEEIA